MILWLNGPFGAGKTTTANRLIAADPRLILFDTENIGYMLQPVLERSKPVANFQDWSAWRRLVVATLLAIADETGADLVVPQTVLVEVYWTEIADGLRDGGLVVHPFTLDVHPDEHDRRIANDSVEVAAVHWRRERRIDFDAARDWLERSTTIVDTTQLTPEEVAQIVREPAP